MAILFNEKNAIITDSREMTGRGRGRNKYIKKKSTVGVLVLKLEFSNHPELKTQD